MASAKTFALTFQNIKISKNEEIESGSGRPRILNKIIHCFGTQQGSSKAKQGLDMKQNIAKDCSGRNR